MEVAVCFGGHLVGEEALGGDEKRALTVSGFVVVRDRRIARDGETGDVHGMACSYTR